MGTESGAAADRPGKTSRLVLSRTTVVSCAKETVRRSAMIAQS
jgi:hypothetical protein